MPFPVAIIALQNTLGTSEINYAVHHTGNSDHSNYCGFPMGCIRNS